MKIAFICAFAHLTIIEKSLATSGRVPDTVVCGHIGCGCPSAMFKFQIDTSVVATHEFYSSPAFGEIITIEEQNFLDAGGLLFRTIPENVPDKVKNEFVATEGMRKLGNFILNNFPKDQHLPDIVDTAINFLKKYQGHLSLMKTLNKTGKDLN